MPGRRNLTKSELDRIKFDSILRFMIVAAENKRCVEYSEINKVFGISLEDIRDYAAYLGDYCHENNSPYLNCLIINTKNGMPGDDFFTWAENSEDNWGVYVAKCFSHYHLPSDNSVRFQNTSGISSKVEQFLDE